jgi:membrane-associated phospholipid phosphatase
MPVYKEFYLVTIAILGAGIIAYAIRHYWKISAHMTSLTVSIISLAIINNMFIVFAILIPIVAWCRIKLKAHTYFQVIGGAILGILMPLLVHFVF